MHSFMEVFTVTFLTYALVVPCFVVMIGVVILSVTQMFDAFNNTPLMVFLALFILFTSSKIFNTLDHAPYFRDRMEEFQGLDSKLD